MYKIYINDTPLFLVSTTYMNEHKFSFENQLVARYNGKPKYLLPYIDMLEKTNRYDAIVLHYNNAKSLFRDFKSLYKRVNASGGVVFNSDGDLLMIYRRGFWDLPKGKIDPGEGKMEAAIREVQEETGLHQLAIVKRLTKTRHTYRLKSGKRILKYSYWYIMTTTDMDLVPQEEEDIEKAVWRKPAEFLESGDKAYASINDVIKAIND